jgi:signal transduction histidine kinase
MLDLQHNVVNLLYTMQGMIDVHRSRFEEGRFQKQEEALASAQEVMNRVYTQAERALAITKKLSRVSKIRDVSYYAPSVVSLQEVWREVLRILKRKQGGVMNIEIIEHIPEGFPKILCQRNDLIEILYCLADNAVHAMKGNTVGGRRASPLPQGKIILRASVGYRGEDERVATISFADTGPGIPEEILNRLFEPFMTTKPPDQGNGLGLCLVKGLVRKNSGTISVSSFQGCGTTFTLTMPLSKVH